MFEYRSAPPEDPTYEARRQALSEAIRFVGDDIAGPSEVVEVAEKFHAFLVGGA